MPVKHCCYGNCNSDSRYVGTRKEMEKVFFIPFPKPKTQKEKCERWVRLCGRRYFGVDNVRKETYICSKHFIGGEGPTTDHPDPIPAVATELELRILSSKRKRKSPAERTCQTITKSSKKELFPCVDQGHESDEAESSNAIPKQFYDHIYSKMSDESEENPDSPKESAEHEDIYIDPCEGMVDTVEEEVSLSAMYCDSHSQTSGSVNVTNVEVQTDICMEHLSAFSTASLQDTSSISRNIFMDSVLKNDDSCKFYTGLSLVMFTFLLTWLKEKALRLNYWRGQDTTESKSSHKKGPKRKLTVTEELVLTLVRLRRGLDVEVLSDIFAIHKSLVSRIFTTWINFLYQELSFLISWPSREQVIDNLPKAFKCFPKTRSIIDCTEFFIQKPSLPSSQRITWSQYKHNNTLKALVAISPTGTFTFFSKLYSGSISDRRIVEESGFLEHIEHGDDIMADRGFLIRDLLAKQSATLNIPPFSMGKQLSSRAVTKTRRIASARIHVERAIGRLKTFKILQGIIPLKMYPLLDQIITVCGALCNLDNQLVK